MTLSKFFKRGFAVLSAVVLIMTAVAGSSVYAADESIKPGDVNNDNFVNIKDVTLIQKVLVKLAEEPEGYKERADMNLDGYISIKDATIIQMYIAQMIKELPYKRGEETTTAETTSVTQAPTDETKVNPTETTEAVKPTDATAKPTEATVKPTEATVKPTEATEKPTEATVKPTEATQKPTEAETTKATQPETDEDGFDPHIYRP